MTIVLIAASVFCSWALLSVLGGERQRRLHDLEAEQDNEADAPPQAPAGTRPRG